MVMPAILPIPAMLDIPPGFAEPLPVVAIPLMPDIPAIPDIPDIPPRELLGVPMGRLGKVFFAPVSTTCRVESCAPSECALVRIPAQRSAAARARTR